MLNEPLYAFYVHDYNPNKLQYTLIRALQQFDYCNIYHPYNQSLLLWLSIPNRGDDLA
jgi:hypothetical protein